MVSIEPDTIPSMPLYMDQVRSFMESILSDSKRRSDDKILTKTMINNYAKNKLLPPPENKKYSREHIMVLIYIYYFKQMLSMNDIQKLMKPVYSEFSHASKLEKVFSQVMECCSYEKETAKKTALEKIDYIEENFPKLTEREEDFKLFLLISDLLCDIYSKKVIVERLIDLL
ncbi:MAG: DUF1836 domain-containing protein [Lachnospiraceae bacterium]|nr:DUF1836 domain-containing protein [Lachnospiraceae bacterium]